VSLPGAIPTTGGTVYEFSGVQPVEIVRQQTLGRGCESPLIANSNTLMIVLSVVCAVPAIRLSAVYTVLSEAR
jgi:hypothetical protein